METDRFQINKHLFIVGLISLVSSMALFALSFYIMPNLLFGWYYDTPSFINQWVAWLQYQHDFTQKAASKIIFFSVFFLGCFFAFLAYISSNRIDNEIFKSELHLEVEEDNNSKKSRGDALQLTIKILLIALGVFIISALFEWLIYTPPRSQESSYAYIGQTGGHHGKVIE